MAADIGVKIALEGEKQYREQMRQITQQTKTMRAETQAMEAKWNKNASAQQKAAQQTQQLKTQIEQQNKSVATAEANLNRYSEAYGENDRRTLQWKQTLAEAKTELARLQAELEKVPNNLQIMGQKMQEAGQNIQSVGKVMTSAGSTLTRNVTVPIAALGAASVKTTADFDESMSKVQALSGATGKDFDRLRNKARQMGATTKYSAGEAADSLGFMALAGWDTNQMIEGLDGVLNLAAASGMDLAEASDLVTDYLSAFGLEAKDSSRMADQLAYAQAHSNTTTTQLGEAFGNSAAQMHTAGQTMETTTAILEAFANQGLKGSEAGTALSAMVRDLSKHMEDGKVQIGDTAVEVMDANGNFRDMTDILADVETATDGLGSAEKDMALRMVFGDRSIKGVSMALTEGSGNIQRYRDELTKADGTAQAMADTMQNNLKGQLTILKSQLQELGISFGDILVPHIRKAVEWLQQTVDKFNSLDSSTKEQIVKFAALAASIGPVLLVGGKLVTSIGQIVEGAGKAVSWVGKITAGFSGAESAAGALSSVLGPLGLALAGVIGAVALVKAGYENFREKAKETNRDLYSSIDAVNETTKALNNAGTNIAQNFTEADKAIQDVEATAKAATNIAEEIEELTNKTKLSHEEQLRLKVLVDEMNALYPEMGLAIDETTGALNKSSDAIQAYIKEAYKMAKVEAYTNALKSAMESMADAEFTAAQAAVAHDRLLEEQAELEDEVAAATERRDGITLGSILTDTKAATEKAKLNDEITTGKVALEDAKEALEANKEAQDANSAAVDEAQKAYDDAYKVMEELAAEMGVSVDELLNMTEAAEDNAEAVSGSGEAADEAAGSLEQYGEAAEDAGETTEDAAKKIRESYESSYKSALSSVQGQGKLWQEFTKQEAVSAEQIHANLQSQIKAYSDWNQNVSTLVNSGRYQHDEAFRAMVDSLINAGIDMAPELATIVSLYESGSSELSGILDDFGDASVATTKYSQTMAEWETIAEYGVEAVNSAFGRGSKTVSKSAEGLPKAASSGLRSGKGDVSSASDEIGEAATAGIKAVQDQTSEAEETGKELGGNIATGVRATRGDINSAFTSLRTAISTNITQIQNLKSTAKTAGQNLASSINDGIVASTGMVTTAMNGVKASVETGIKNVESKKTSAKSAGTTIGSELAAGLDGKQSDVSAAGRRLGDAAANGVGGASGNAQANGRKVIDAAANELKKYEGSQEPWTWGRHLGDNFANGISSAYGNVLAQAQRLARAVHDNLHFTHPDEGPLKSGTEIWGLHLGRDFARGMEQSIPAVESAALGITDAAAMIPTATTLDIDAISGRNVRADALTPMNITDAFIAAAENIDWRVMIGSREFGRILREQGVYA